MARKIAASLSDVTNSHSRGQAMFERRQAMFERRQKRSPRWIHQGECGLPRGRAGFETRRGRAAFASAVRFQVEAAWSWSVVWRWTWWMVNEWLMGVQCAVIAANE